MKRVVVDRYGGPEVLRVVEENDPRPGRGEVRVRVLAAGVSFSDALLRAGVYLGGPKPPFTPGYTGLRQLATAPPSSGSARSRSTTTTTTSWSGRATSPGEVSTLCSTGSVARSRFAPSARRGRAEGWSCSATPPRLRRGAGAVERGQ